MAKELLFSVTRKDFDWQFIRGSGAGGQKRNKTSSVVRCVHRASAAVGLAGEHREQSKNRAVAFERCVRSPEFTAWHRMEVCRRTSDARVVHQAVEQAMMPANIRVEYYDPDVV